MEKISVIMGIYNCESTLPEAIDSIIHQTYTNWELIMCDDGSKDGTLSVAESYALRYPEQIVVLKNERNMGLNFTLNKCLSVAKGEYIARMDGDDISLCDRFEKELSVLKNNPQYSIVSCGMILFDADGEWGRVTLKEKPVARDLVKGTPFCHAPCLVKKEAYDAVDGYSVDDKLLRVEDYHLWAKMYASGFIGINLQESLYKMRDDKNAQKRRKFKYRVNEARVKKYVVKTLHLPVYNYVHCLKPIILGFLPGWLYKILHKRKQSNKT